MSVITVIMTVVRGHKNICILFIFLLELLFVIVFFSSVVLECIFKSMNMMTATVVTHTPDRRVLDSRLSPHTEREKESV